MATTNLLIILKETNSFFNDHSFVIILSDDERFAKKAINYIGKMNTTLKFIMLHAKTGVFEITEKSNIRLDQTFTIKDTTLEIPI